MGGVVAVIGGGAGAGFGIYYSTSSNDGSGQVEEREEQDPETQVSGGVETQDVVGPSSGGNAGSSRSSGVGTK